MIRPPLCVSSVFLWILFGDCTDRASAAIGPDGICNIYALAPFATLDGDPIYSITGKTKYTLGHLQLAASLLAVRHFNSRNATIVPEIANIPKTCNVTLNISKVFNAVPGDYSAIRWISANRPPNCAFVGPSDDSTANDIQVLARSYSIPLVTTRTFDSTIVFDEFTSSVYPDLVSSARKIVQYLLFKKRDNYIAFLYDLNGANFQRREALALELDSRDIRWIGSSFGSEQESDLSESVYSAMKQIKDVGYRTIIVALSDPGSSFQLLADAAEELEMNRGGHFYVWYDEFDPFIWRQNNTNVTNISAGSAWIVPPSLRSIKKEDDIFGNSWDDQGQDFIDALAALHPFRRGEKGYVETTPDFYQEASWPELTTAQMYDATMSIGIGACLARAATKSTVISGSDHQQGIRKSSFLGSSGLVEFGIKDSNQSGNRRGDTIYWTAINLIAPPNHVTFPEWIDPTQNGGAWFSVEDFVYAYNTTTPPALLRDTPNQNYLSVGIRVVGLTLMAITMATAIFCAGWVFIRRKHRIVAASQPAFLYLICFGSCVQTSAILPASFDESSGWSAEQLSEACMAIPWLFTVGYIIVYSSLFTKLWRVNKVLQFSKRRIKIKHVVWPMAIMVLIALLLLVLLTVLDPLQWQREEINSTTGDSMGSCSSDSTVAFVVPLAAVMLIPSLMTMFMAWKTKDVDETFAEGRWIFILILLQIEVVLIALPVMVILQNVSTNGIYVGLMFLLWLFPTSTLSLVFFPKIVAYRRSLRGDGGAVKSKRGQRTNCKVSGVPDIGSPPPSTAEGHDPYLNQKQEQYSIVELEASSTAESPGHGQIKEV